MQQAGLFDQCAVRPVQVNKRQPGGGRMRDDHDIPPPATPRLRREWPRAGAGEPGSARLPRPAACSSRSRTGWLAARSARRLPAAAGRAPYALAPEYGRSRAYSSAGAGAAGPQRPHGLMGVPVDLLDVHRRNGEAVTAPGATTLQHVPAAACRHPRTEAVHALTTTNLRLVGTLGRHCFVLGWPNTTRATPTYALTKNIPALSSVAGTCCA